MKEIVGELIMEYGTFFDNRKGYRINTVRTPIPWRNILFNDEYFMEVSQRLASPSSFFENHNKTAVIKPEKQFYARIGEKIYQLSNGKGKSFTCEHYIYKTVVTEDFGEFISKITVFVPNEGQRELWNVEILNTSGKELKIDIFACYEFENNVYMILECDAENGYFIKNTMPYHVYYEEYEKVKNADKNFYAMSNKPLKSYECSKRRFLGHDSSTEIPQMIENGYGACAKAQFEDCVAAFHNELVISEGASDSVTYLLGVEKEIRKIEDMYKNMPCFSEELKKTKEKWDVVLEHELVDTDNTEFNYMVNYWLKKQVIFLARHNRGAVCCPVRNQLQDAMGYAVINPEEAFKLGLNILRMQNENGHLKQWHMLDGSADRGLCLIQHSDACVWLIICMIEIINLTGRPEYFDYEEVYVDSNNKENIMTHLKKAALYMSTQVGEHGLCLMKDGDWTDPINGPGRKGKGESTWNTLALIYAIKLLLKVEYDEQLDRIQKELTYSVNKYCWDEDRYIAGINDDGIPFGAKNDKEASLFLNAQTWAIFAEVCQGEKLEKVRKTIETLKTDFGYLLLDPPFRNWNDIWGKISVKQAGTCENGAVYCHANMFKAYADFYIGDYNLGMDTTLAIMPNNPKNPTENNKQTPIFVPNYYFGDKGVNYGRSSDVYSTGAAAWILWLANKYMRKE